MIRKAQDSRHVDVPPRVKSHPSTTVEFPTYKIHFDDKIRSARFLDQELVATALSLFAGVQNCTRFAASLRVRSTAPQPPHL
jgi:hypothetical protein